MYGTIYIYEFKGDATGRIPWASDRDYIGCWREAGYSFLFFHRQKHDLFERLRLPYRSELAIRHEDWESGIPLRPIKIGRIGIYQPWNAPNEPGINIAIDPNMAFGSGFHFSTKGCLTLLDRLLSRWLPRRVLDLGTGTGILSLACLKMGAPCAVGVDDNDLALRTAANNGRINGLAERMLLIKARAEEMLPIETDLLVANIHYSALSLLVERPEFYGRRYYVLSGMIRGEAKVIEERLKGKLELVDAYCEEFWSTYLFSYKGLEAAPPA
jgi:ribosomal protein L11 methyltransferase